MKTKTRTLPRILALAVVIVIAILAVCVVWKMNRHEQPIPSYEMIEPIEGSYALIEIADYALLGQEDQYQLLPEDGCYFAVGPYGEVVANQINIWNNYDMFHAGLRIGWLDSATYQQAEETDALSDIEEALEYFKQCVAITKANWQAKITICSADKLETKEVCYINTGNDMQQGTTEVMYPAEAYAEVYISDDSMVVETADHTYYYASTSFPQGFTSMIMDFAVTLFSAYNGSTVFYFDEVG